MAKNRKFADATRTRSFLDDDAEITAVSELPNCVGQIPMVCLTTAKANADGDDMFTGQLDGVFELKVQGKDSSGTSGADASVAVAPGDILYFDGTPATASYYLSKRAGGIRFGYALEAVGSGSNATIKVQVGY